MTIECILKALEKSWTKETAFAGDRDRWSNDNKAKGQCTVTAMVIYDYFGGKIIRGYSKKYDIYHYWNEIDGEKIDLTFSQFEKEMPDIEFDRLTEKKKRDLMRIHSVKKRYNILRQSVEKNLV